VGAKEAGAAMTVGGEQVALGIPGVDDPDEMATLAGCPLRRAGTPDEAAGAMLMLACKHSSYISGQAIEVTGGSFL
jgi:3-oxoacyl-[acyl-carrier protein] reductase